VQAVDLLLKIDLIAWNRHGGENRITKQHVCLR
jgi:hypothetical protein